MQACVKNLSANLEMAAAPAKLLLALTAATLAASEQIEVADAGATSVSGEEAIAEVKRLMEEEHQPVVDAMLQGTTKIAVGHKPSSDAFAEELTKFEAAARGIAFHEVEDTPSNRELRADLFKASCVSMAALSAELGDARRTAAEDDSEHGGEEADD